MNRTTLIALISALCTTAHATQLVCSVDARNDTHMCFPDTPMRVSTDGKTRQFPLYRGGPNRLTKTGHTATVYCTFTDIVPVLELRDSSGIIYAREQAVSRLGMEFTTDVCGYKKTRVDKKLDARR